MSAPESPPDTPSSLVDTADDVPENGDSSLPLPVLLIIVIVSIILASVSLSFFSLWLSRRQSSRHGLALVDGETAGAGGSVQNDSPISERTKYPSTDSTLSEILWSTEQRLQEGAANTTAGGAASRRSNKTTRSPNKTTAGTIRESLLSSCTKISRESPLTARCASPATQSRTPSLKKSSSSYVQPATGHRRQESQASVNSDADSLLVESCLALDDPTGLKSPSRTPTKPQQIQEAEAMETQSVRSLSTIDSEDEMSEGGSRAAAASSTSNETAPSRFMNDPFSPDALSSTSRPTTSLGWPEQPQKSQNFFRESLERSQRLCRATISQAPASLPPEVRLPSCPPGVPAGKHISFHWLEYSESMGGQTRSSFVFQPAVAATSRTTAGPYALSSIAGSKVLTSLVLLPPTNSGSCFVFGKGSHEATLRPSSMITTVPDQQQLRHQDRSYNFVPVITSFGSKDAAAAKRDCNNSPSISSSSSSPSRITRLPAQQRNDTPISISSSVYSQDTAKDKDGLSAAAAAGDFNGVSFLANTILGISTPPSPLPPTVRIVPPSLGRSSGRNLKTPSLRIASSARAQPGPEYEDEFEDNDDDDEGDDDGGDDEGRELDGSAPLLFVGGIASTVAELRRMNSGISTVSTPAGSPATSSVVDGAGHTQQPTRNESAGHRHYLSLGSPSKRRAIAAVKKSGSGSPQQHQQQQQRRTVGGAVKGIGAAASLGNRSSLPRVSLGLRISDAGVSGEKENGNILYRDSADFFKMPSADFTFEVAAKRGSGRSLVCSDSPSASAGGSVGGSGGRLVGGLRECGSGGIVPFTSFSTHKARSGAKTGSVSPRRRPVDAASFGSRDNSSSPQRGRSRHRRSDESLGLYDKEGFLICSPIRHGDSSPGLRV
ncbi:hypothetical protein B0H63DRAFT_525500 [Podospora didyma]|uniref:Uncharacterized protein n=1 Tax=Podospora didyma TaxID=330526 RepID=A0AAE0KLR5_9PEZI|nr:hypothetical protein B0H63DRAFT_525500 [Podospora didyma]